MSRWLARIAVHGAVGALGGYLLLHTLSVNVYYVFEQHAFDLSIVLKEAFSPLHLPMALYFGAIGAAIGIGYGAYSARLGRLYEEVRKLSLTDSLTSLYNRRYLMVRLNEEADRCLRYARSLTIIMADIDHFKHYDDAHGHQQGGLLLREVAAVLRGHVRKPDFVARYGGEEFAIVMPETGRLQALNLADRMREAVGKLATPAGEDRSATTVTMSFGVAELPADAADVESLIRDADRALYHAKETGRNRVVSRREIPSPQTRRIHHGGNGPGRRPACDATDLIVGCGAQPSRGLYWRKPKFPGCRSIAERRCGRLTEASHVQAGKC